MARKMLLLQAKKPKTLFARSMLVLLPLFVCLLDLQWLLQLLFKQATQLMVAFITVNQFPCVSFLLGRAGQWAPNVDVKKVNTRILCFITGVNQLSARSKTFLHLLSSSIHVPDNEVFSGKKNFFKVLARLCAIWAIIILEGRVACL